MTSSDQYKSKEFNRLNPRIGISTTSIDQRRQPCSTRILKTGIVVLIVGAILTSILFILLYIRDQANKNTQIPKNNIKQMLISESMNSAVISITTNPTTETIQDFEEFVDAFFKFLSNNFRGLNLKFRAVRRFSFPNDFSNSEPSIPEKNNNYDKELKVKIQLLSAILNYNMEAKFFYEGLSYLNNILKITEEAEEFETIIRPSISYILTSKHYLGKFWQQQKSRLNEISKLIPVLLSSSNNLLDKESDYYVIREKCPDLLKKSLSKERTQKSVELADSGIKWDFGPIHIIEDIDEFEDSFGINYFWIFFILFEDVWVKSTELKFNSLLFYKGKPEKEFLWDFVGMEYYAPIIQYWEAMKNIKLMEDSDLYFFYNKERTKNFLYATNWLLCSIMASIGSH